VPKATSFRFLKKRSEVMDIFVSRQPQERLYLVQYDPKKDTSNYREVAFLGWSTFGSSATPVGLRGHIIVSAYTSAWVVELDEGRFTSPTLGIGLFNDLEDVLQRLHRGFQQEAEGSE
jgi:hypothetical protein